MSGIQCDIVANFQLLRCSGSTILPHIHTHVWSMGVDRSGGTPSVLSPKFLGADIFNF